MEKEMRNKLLILLTGSFLLMLLLGMYVVAPSPPAKEYELKIVKVDGVWKVVDASDYSKSKVKVKRKDTIVWTADGTDAYFQFSTRIFNPVGEADSLVDGYTKFLKDGKKLKLKVKDDAPIGIEIYAVFCTAGQVFAKGESPPTIVVE